MNEKQALEIIKAILDLGVQKGIFVKMDEAFTAIQAFNTIAEKFKDEPAKDADTN
jgi:hypothetical protein